MERRIDQVHEHLINTKTLKHSFSAEKRIHQTLKSWYSDCITFKNLTFNWAVWFVIPQIWSSSQFRLMERRIDRADKLEKGWLPIVDNWWRSAQNYKRVIEVWFDDEYKEYFYTREPTARYLDMGDITQQLAIKKRLNCKSFDWFMKNVAYDVVDKYPKLPPNVHWGEVRSFLFFILVLERNGKNHSSTRPWTPRRGCHSDRWRALATFRRSPANHRNQLIEGPLPPPPPPHTLRVREGVEKIK